MDIREFARTVWSGKYFIAAALVIVLAGTFFYLDRQQAQFQATATVQLNSSEAVPGVDAAGAVTANADTSIVTAPPVVEAAAEALGFTGEPSTLAARVTATFIGANLVMEITGTYPDRAMAQDIANAFAQAYVAHLPAVIDDQVAQLDQRRQALRDQLTVVDAQVGADPDDPLAGAERETVISQYQAISAQISTFQSIVVPAQVLTPATGSVPLGLAPRNVVALAVLAGIVAGVGLSLIRRGLDPTVRSVNEGAAEADSPVLAELYLVDRAHKDFKKSGILPISSRIASPFTESIRELRTAAQVALNHTTKMVLVVTAADPHAPRSFIAANLAASWALSGRRVIAFSADMRRPQLDGLLPAPEDWEGDPHELRPTTVPNLSLFPVPDVPLDPADYLATPIARGLIESLRERADIVVVDAPPALAGADATILGGYADGVVLIASGGETDRAVLHEAAHRLRINNVPLIGLAYAGGTGGRRMVYATTYGGTTGIVAGPAGEDEDFEVDGDAFASHDARVPVEPTARNSPSGETGRHQSSNERVHSRDDDATANPDTTVGASRRRAR